MKTVFLRRGCKPNKILKEDQVNKRTMLLALLAVLLCVGFVTAGAVKTTGSTRVLILVAEDPEDAADYGDGELPPFYDSIVAPNTAVLNPSDPDYGLYKWSVTNYYATASWNKLMMCGEVNPNYDHKYIILSQPCRVLGNCRQVALDMIQQINDEVDFSLYDNNPKDGVVDYIVFLIPRNPGNFIDYPVNHGSMGVAVSGDLLTTVDGVKIMDRYYMGSTHSYYITDEPRITPMKLIDVTYSVAHEVGHLFETINVNGVTGLGDCYDEAGAVYDEGPPPKAFVNAHAQSAVMGRYSPMVTGLIQEHPPLYSPWDRVLLGWIEPTEITENIQFIRLRDFNTPPRSAHPEDWDSMLYKIPIDSVYNSTKKMWNHEYFLVCNYQNNTTHWVNDLGRSLPSDEWGTPHPDAHDVLIWHINEEWYYGGSCNSELAKYEDLECAEGLMNLDGTADSPYGSELGWDRVDRWSSLMGEGWNISHNASTTHPNDFFRPGYKWAFTSLTNPCSDAYLKGSGYEFGYEYPAAPPDNMTWTEKARLQNVVSHVSIEGIRYYPNEECPDGPEEPGDVMLCIRRSRIWSDRADVMDRSTQRKFIYDEAHKTYHCVYASKGYIYYTTSEDPSKIWNTAAPLNPVNILIDEHPNATWPALAVDPQNNPIVVWHEGSKILLKHYNGVWSPTYTLRDLGSVPPAPAAIFYKEWQPANKGIFIAYMKKVGNQYEVRFAKFDRNNPTTPLLDILVDVLDADATRPVGVSLVVDRFFNASIVYGGVKNGIPGCFYRVWRNTFLCNPTPFSATTLPQEPLVPFVDLEKYSDIPMLDSVRIVYGENGRIYYKAKLVTDIYNSVPWTTPEEVSQSDNCYLNYAPQVDGNFVTWTRRDNLSGGLQAFGREWPAVSSIGEFPVCPYEGISFLCQVTKVGDKAAAVYEYGNGPRWQVFYRGPDGFGGNVESDGPASLGNFDLTVIGNIVSGTNFSIQTTGACNVSVFDITGRRLTQLKVEQGGPTLTRISCEEWPKGVYFVQAVRDGTTRTAKVVIAR